MMRFNKRLAIALNLVAALTLAACSARPAPVRVEYRTVPVEKPVPCLRTAKPQSPRALPDLTGDAVQDARLLLAWALSARAAYRELDAMTEPCVATP